MRRWPLFLTLISTPLVASCSSVPDASQLYQQGVHAFEVHDYASAQLKLEQAAKLWPPSTDRQQKEADTWLYLARTLSEEGRYQSAEDALTQAIKYLSVTHGPDSRAVALALLKLSACHHKQGEYAEAAPVCERALAIEKKALPPQDLLLAATANNLAETYERLGNQEKAEQLFKQAIAIYRQQSETLDGKKGLLETLNNLALFYKQQTRMPEAIQTAKSAITLSSGRSPVAISGRAESLNTLATIERAQFDQQAATADYKQALDLLARSPAFDDDLFAEVSGNYASMLLEQKDYDLAEQQFKQAIEHLRPVHGQMHPALAKRMKELAALYREQGRLTEAEDLLRKALAIDKVAFQSDSPITMDTMNNLSAVLVAQKRYSAAEDVYADWMPTLVKVLGPDHPHVADALENWALVADKANDSDLALKLRAQAKRIRIKSERPLASESGFTWCLKACAARTWLSV